MKLQHSISQAERHLANIDNNPVDAIMFDWQGINFDASTEELADGSCTVRLHATLGRLYFTAESTSNRTAAIENLYGNNRKIDGAYSIGEKGEVRFSCMTTTKKKLSDNDFLAALTTIVIQASPHLCALRSLLRQN